MQLSLYPFQKDVLDRTKGKTRCAYYMDMGLGKTFVGAEKMKRLGARVNLIICQKSKITDWVQHFADYYADDFAVCDLTDDQRLGEFMEETKTVSGESEKRILGVINYDLAFRRKELGKLKDFTLMLDESSLIQNERAKRSRFILKLNVENVILLSGTPVSGKYEKLWSQCHLLGWKITKERFYDHYIVIGYAISHETGFNIPKVIGYKNVDRLKRKLSEYGAVFMKTEEVLDLPDQQEITISVPITKEYSRFMKNDIVWVGEGREKQLIGDTMLTKHLYARQLCGQYNQQKIDAFRDLLDSTSDRLIVFYNFVEEYRILRGVCDDTDRAVSYINGSGEDLDAYETVSDSVTLVQYQAGAMGKNLQKANKAVYFTLSERSELYEQSKKRIHRIGQKNTCFYYTLLCKGTIEAHIQKTLAMRKDFTDELFEEWDKERR